MNTFYNIFGCFPSKTEIDYVALSKKHEDYESEEGYGNEAIKSWQKTYTPMYVQSYIRNTSLKKIKEYAREVMKALGQIPLTPANLDIAQKHLIDLSKRSCHLKEALADRLNYLSIKDQKRLVSLRLAILLTSEQLSSDGHS
ncbi:hypothetical protein [Candidatus Protochlamydia sp. W-9]|uniref:hypothetical protein n=1 Tax=Candidatus Protochlamydia sp. W-9 TaxID=1785087 RepID=UPI00096A8204|nr:hypothetical protein [Candidatus Protochlamydia sp. W-9]